MEAKMQREKEENLQIAVLDVKNRYGKNAVMKAFDLQVGATQIERNMQIGGHKA